MTASSSALTTKRRKNNSIGFIRFIEHFSEAKWRHTAFCGYPAVLIQMEEKKTFNSTKKRTVYKTRGVKFLDVEMIMRGELIEIYTYAIQVMSSARAIV